MDPVVARKWRRYQYRKLHTGLTAEQYENEPREAVDWDLQFARLEADLEAETVKEAQRNR